MKATFLILFFLVIAFVIKPLPAAADDPEPVLDKDSEQVKAGLDYYILPKDPKLGGGFTLASIENTSCPLDVIQERDDALSGYPVRFSTVNSDNGVVYISADLNIKFSRVKTACVSSPVWKVDRYNASEGPYFVSVGGVEKNPGPDTVANWFKIEKFNDDYKLVFCPNVCNSSCNIPCRSFGMYKNNGIRRLALSRRPVKFIFRRA
ncbi:hypothetical protein HS088_TW23G00845 [Tripterygium wilfordii]|uniref:Miraculin-like n=1 Tax=Tripterygium wilfordii TaxID=458696 RepID=A0A7J7BW67_TRIWF|nr:kunitz trypsin inhibitor 5-like [Tripterygium wilfordii]KAF5726104.1 hypothetical protein HS088_TW23G00845 [Tripterygium wilfordii]